MEKITKITKEYLESLIADKKFILDETFTVCILKLKNWFKLVGTSAPISAENFDKKIWEEISYENAFEKLWELEWYKNK